MTLKPLVAALSALAFTILQPAFLAAQAQSQQPVTVFAAASLTNALQEVCDAVAARTGANIKISFAASSTLAKQIEAGAGAQMFVSADEPWMDYLQKRERIETGTRRTLLGNRLVLVVPSDRPVEVEIAAGKAWLDKLGAGRIATGDPEHVPVGRYAQQALTRLGAWPDVSSRLARADNVRNALVLVERGEAAAGIVYATDAAASKKVKVAGLFPENTHDPVTYPVALVRGQGQGQARQVYESLFTAEARDIFVKHGFTVR